MARKISKTAFGKRVFRWHTSERASNRRLKIDNYPHGCIYENQCSSCSATLSELRWIEPGPGYICKTCWYRNPACSVPGCEEIALKDCDGMCREHYFNYQKDKADYKERGIERGYERDYSVTESMFDDEVISKRHKRNESFPFYESFDRGTKKVMADYKAHPEKLHLRKIDPKQGESKCG